MPRSKVETDYNYKQIIPYVLIRYNGEYLHYVRGKKAGETRLVSNGSIGIGGHISQDDDSLFHSDINFASDIYDTAVNREVNEEIILISNVISKSIVAVINDDTNEVGRVHFGIVHLWELDGNNIKKNEQNITKVALCSVDELLTIKNSLENWSQICVDEIITKIS